MSYQVIARKYRPQTFADLTGQEHITRTLEHALEQQRLHHAYLFSGVRGTGKTTTARILAKGLNCAIGITAKPCLECASCCEIAAGNSIDVIEIDAASNTGVDNVRDVIINNIAVAPARDRYKVFIIDEVHMLSTSAFNALLKTLEEPPSHVVFIMATTELHKVPDTILSRCQQFEFRHIPIEKILLRLREIAKSENVEANDAALREIARAGGGSLRDAQSAFDQVVAFSGAKITEDDVIAALGLVGMSLLGRVAEAIATQNGEHILTLVAELDSRGYDLRNFARELMAYLRHLLVIKSGITDADVIGVADVEMKHLSELAARFSEEDLVRSFHLLAAVEKEIKDSPYPRFTLEVGLFKLTHVLRLRSLNELIARLEALATQLDSGSVPAAPISSSTPKAITSANDVTVAAKSRQESAPSSTPELSAPSSFDNHNSFDVTEPANLPDFEPPSLPRSVRSETISSPPSVTEATAEKAVTHGREVTAICAELERLNRVLLLTAIEEAQSVQYENGRLIVTYGNDNIFASRVRDSQAFFRDLGERLFKQSLHIEVRISNQVETRVDKVSSVHEQLRERAMQNPTVRMFIEKFRGEVIDVQELQREP